MRFFCLLFILCGFTRLSAQEYWNREDFEIGNRSIENTWKEVGFTWQTESRFQLPEVNFLEKKVDVQKKQVNMLAVIDEVNRKKVERKVDLGSPIPREEKDRKTFEVSLERRLRDDGNIFSNPYYANPFLNNYHYRGFGARRYSTPYRIIN